MNRDQWIVLHGLASGWPLLGLLCDFDRTKDVLVARQSGLVTPDQPGTCVTTRKGMFRVNSFADRTTPVVSLTWSEIRTWARGQSASVLERAAELRREGREHQAAYPTSNVSIGRPYAWDIPGSTPEQHDADRAAYDAALEARKPLLDAWYKAGVEVGRREREFIDSLAPSDEPADLLELLAAIS